MNLFIDTTDFNKITFAVSGNKVIKRVYKVDAHKSHETLKFLDEFLNKFQDPKNKIQKIVVNKGPGSYTGVRVGVTIAQALGLAWDVPVKAVPKEKFEIK